MGKKRKAKKKPVFEGGTLIALVGLVIILIYHYGIKESVSDYGGYGSKQTHGYVYDVKGWGKRTIYYKFAHNYREYKGSTSLRGLIPEKGDSCIIEYMEHDPTIHDYKGIVR